MNEAWGDYTNIEQEREKVGEGEGKESGRDLLFIHNIIVIIIAAFYGSCLLLLLFSLAIKTFTSFAGYILVGFVCLNCQLCTWLVGWPKGISVCSNSWFSFEANSTRQSSGINLCVSLLVSGLVFFNCTQSIRHVERDRREEGEQGEIPFWQHLLDQNESLLNLTLIPFACAQFTKVFCIN